MNIMPVNNIELKKGTNFKSSLRQYAAKDIPNFLKFGQEVILTSTNLFREDLNWDSFAKYIISHFAYKPKINIYSLACSDGSEAYSAAISLMEKLPKILYDKYLPIHASDIDQVSIQYAKSGKLDIFSHEIYYAQKGGIDLSKYINIPEKDLSGKSIKDIDKYESYEIKELLKNKVNFSNSDIYTELTKIKDSGNTVVMCRNVMPYLAPKHVTEILNLLKRVLKSGSLFVTGNFDEKVRFGNKLLNNGFFIPNQENLRVYQRL